MRPVFALSAAVTLVSLASCAGQVQEVSQSRERLWQQFGQQPVDALLMAWGTPERETRLTDGSRMLAYQHTTVIDADMPGEYRRGCEVTFMAQAPQFRIANVAMEGNPYECQLLAQGKTGYAQHMNTAPPAPYYRSRYHRNYPYPYRYPF
jgi:hypothetical protein